jgi:hypothetical protein
MPTQVLMRRTAQTIDRSGIPIRRLDEENSARSIAGVLIFSSIGLGLTVFAVLFQWLELPPPYF